MCVQFRVLSLIILFIGILPGNAKAEEDRNNDQADVNGPVAELERESPASLLETELGDNEVDLFIVGSWQTRIGFDVGLARPRRGAEVPGLPTGRLTGRDFTGFDTPTFENIVDLTLSLRLDDRYFFETTFLDDPGQDFEVDSILFGYDGRPEDTLKSLRVGLGPLSIPAYPFIPAAESAGNTFGASAGFEGASSRHDLLARFEQSTLETVRYLGTRNLSEQRIDPAGYIRNRRFVLPDDGVENLRVFREVGPDGGATEADTVAGGDGRRYEELDLNRDTAFSLAQGTVTLEQPASGRIVATYTANGDRVGEEGLGADFLLGVSSEGSLDTENTLDASISTADGLESTAGADYLEAIGRPPPDDTNGDLGVEDIDLFFDIDGVRGVLLYEPGYFSPFVRADAYAADGLNEPGEEIEVEYFRSGRRVSADIPVRPPARSSDDGDALILGSEGPRAPAGRYPFGAESTLYGPGARSRGEAESFEIVIEQTGAPGNISLSSNVIPGTVSLTRNGIRETRFEVSSSGTVELGFEPNARDTLEFRYRTYDRGADAGELVFASGNRFDVFDNDSLTLSLGGRWDVSQNDFTTESGERDGNITLSSSYEHSGDYLDAYVRGAGALEVADTTGARRLFGMEDRSVSVGLRSHRLLPGAAPDVFEWRDAGTVLGDGNGLGPDSFDLGTEAPAGRGHLLYRDYRSDGALQAYDTGLEDSQIYDYESGSLVGPYATREEGGDRLAAFEYELEAGQWVSGQIQLPPELLEVKPEGFRFHWRAVDGVERSYEGEVDIYVQFGATGEDLDGDGTLDEGASATRPTFPFNDEANGVELDAGGVSVADGRAATEDGTDTGFLAAEDAARIASRRIAAGLAGTTAKQAVTVSFTERERRLISEGRAVRLLVVKSAATAAPAAGRILVGAVELLGSPLLARAVEQEGGEYIPASEGSSADTPAVSAGEVSEKDALIETNSTGPEEPLGIRYPDTLRFGTDSEDQQVLKVSYAGLDEDGNTGTERFVELRGITPPAPLRDYEALVFYVYTGTAGSLTSEIAYGNGEEQGVLARDVTIPDNTGAWQEVRISTTSGEVRVNGEPTGDTAEVDNSIEATQFIFRARPENGLSGEEFKEFYLDEIHLSGARPGVTARMEAGMRYSREEELFRIGGTVPVGNLDVGARSSTEADLSDSTVSSVSGDADIAIDVSVVRLGAEVSGTYSPVFDELVTRGGHSVRVPAGSTGAGDWPLAFEDRYSREFTAEKERDNEARLTTLDLSLAGVSAETSARAAFARGRLSQSWAFDTSWDAPRLSLNVSASQLTGEYIPPSEGYARSWIGSYRLLSGYEPENASERSGQVALGRSASDAVISPFASLEGSYTTLVESGEQRSQSIAEIGFRWSPVEQQDQPAEPVPGDSLDDPTDSAPGSPDSEAATDEQPAGGPRAFAAPFQNLSVEPYYRRELRVREQAEGGSYGADLDRYADVVAEERYLYTSVPFVELFESESAGPFGRIDSGRDRVFYRPSTGLRARRSFGSRLRDLIVPYRLEADVGRSYERAEDALRADSDARFSVSTFAVNLFGRLGAYSLSDIYASDEFFATLSGQFAFHPGSDYSLSWETGARFFGDDDRRLELDNTYNVRHAQDTSRDNETTAAYVWNSPAEFAETIPWPVDYETARFVHREEAELTVSTSTRERATERIRLETGHSSSLELDNTASLAARLRLGWEEERTGNDPAIDFFGLRGELEATFRF